MTETNDSKRARKNSLDIIKKRWKLIFGFTLFGASAGLVVSLMTPRLTNFRQTLDPLHFYRSADNYLGIERHNLPQDKSIFEASPMEIYSRVVGASAEKVVLINDRDLLKGLNETIIPRVIRSLEQEIKVSDSAIRVEASWDGPSQTIILNGISTPDNLDRFQHIVDLIVKDLQKEELPFLNGAQNEMNRQIGWAKEALRRSTVALKRIETLLPGDVTEEPAWWTGAARRLGTHAPDVIRDYIQFEQRKMTHESKISALESSAETIAPTQIVGKIEISNQKSQRSLIVFLAIFSGLVIALTCVFAIEILQL